MKISNSKKELARIISENGGWPERALWAVQDNCIAFFLGGKPEYKSGDRCWYSNCLDGACVGTITRDEKVTNWHQTILSREEYFSAYPAEPSLDDLPVVDAELTPEPPTKPTIEQLAADYRNKLDFANRKQLEAEDAKTVADAALGELVAAGGALGLVIGVAKPEPELVITDWRQLKVGDLVEITTTRDGVNIGEAATIIAIDENNENFPVTVTFPEDKYPLEYSYERPPTTWRFIRRP